MTSLINKLLGLSLAMDVLHRPDVAAALREATEELVNLQGIVDSLAARVAAQSELLSKRAERPAPAGRAYEMLED